jgi:hypothetical protein
MRAPYLGALLRVERAARPPVLRALPLKETVVDQVPAPRGRVGVYLGEDRVDSSLGIATTRLEPSSARSPTSSRASNGDSVTAIASPTRASTGSRSGD